VISGSAQAYAGAQGALGWMYDTGRGVDQDFIEVMVDAR
jgi:TPR repeat protein